MIGLCAEKDGGVLGEGGDNTDGKPDSSGGFPSQICAKVKGDLDNICTSWSLGVALNLASLFYSLAARLTQLTTCRQGGNSANKIDSVTSNEFSCGIVIVLYILLWKNPEPVLTLFLLLC